MKRVIVFILIVLMLYLIYRGFSRRRVVKNMHPASDKIVCFGDSLTAGTGASRGMDYPSQLSRMIGRSIINAGIPGDTTSTALSRLDRDILSHAPGIVLITLGGNDLKNGISRDEAFKNLGDIIKRIQAQGALVVLGGIDIPLWGRGFGDAYKGLSEELGTILIPNIFKGIMGNSSLMSDQIHPNDAGYKRMAEMFRDVLRPYFSD